MEQKKIKVLIKEATLGIGESQFQLGLCFYNGEQVKQDYKRAIHWFEKSLENKCYDSAFYLGQCYRVGLGCDKDLDKAATFLEVASEHGHPMASYILGCVFFQSEDTTKQAKAFKLFKTGADNGLVEAMYNTAVCYADGVGVKKDPKMAYFYYCETAKRKYPMGQYSLGRCYEFGIGVFDFDEMAFFWYSKSAEQGYSEAMISLASCYDRGYGIEQNDNLAGYWYNKALEAGNEKAELFAVKYKKKFNKYVKVEAEATNNE